jgi:hypothetical protein
MSYYEPVSSLGISSFVIHYFVIPPFNATPRTKYPFKEDFWRAINVCA